MSRIAIGALHGTARPGKGPHGTEIPLHIAAHRAETTMFQNYLRETEGVRAGHGIRGMAPFRSGADRGTERNICQ